MDKKGMFGGCMILGLILFIIWVCFILFLVKLTSIEKNAMKVSCDHLDMEFKYGRDFDYCIESNGDAHYANVECTKTIWKKNCTAKLISIGENRIKLTQIN